MLPARRLLPILRRAPAVASPIIRRSSAGVIIRWRAGAAKGRCFASCVDAPGMATACVAAGGKASPKHRSVKETGGRQGKTVIDNPRDEHSPSEGWWSKAAPMLAAGVVLLAAHVLYNAISDHLEARAKHEADVSSTASALQSALAFEMASRSTLSVGDIDQCDALLQLALTDVAQVLSAHPPVILDAYNRVTKHWATEHGAAPFGADVVEEARVQVWLLQSHLLRHRASCHVLLHPSMPDKATDLFEQACNQLNRVDTAVQQLPKVWKRRSAARLQRELCRFRIKYPDMSLPEDPETCESRGRLVGRGDPGTVIGLRNTVQRLEEKDFFTVRSLNGMTAAQHAHGFKDDAAIVRSYQRCAALADGLMGPFQTSDTTQLAKAAASIAEFLNKMAKGGYSADKWHTEAELRANLDQVRAVGGLSVVDTLFLPIDHIDEPPTPTACEVLEQLTRSKLCWRTAITARTNAVWVIATSFHLTSAHDPHTVARLLAGLAAPMSPSAAATAATAGTTPPLRLVNKVYATLDHQWLISGGAGRILAAMAAGLEALSRHNCLDPSVEASAKAEVVACLEVCEALLPVAGVGPRSRELAQVKLVKALLDGKGAEACDAVALFHSHSSTPRGLRDWIWASFVAQVLSSTSDGSVSRKVWTFAAQDVTAHHHLHLQGHVGRTMRLIVEKTRRDAERGIQPSLPTQLVPKRLSTKESLQVVASVTLVRGELKRVLNGSL